MEELPLTPTTADLPHAAPAIEQAVRDCTDFHLPKREVANNRAWLEKGLGIKMHADVSDQDATDAVVRGAAGRGKFKMLSSLYEEGQWHPWRCKLSIEASDEGGHLLDLLKTFPVHLNRYPSLAEEQENPASQELAFAPEPGKVDLGKNPLSRKLTQNTCLLSNLLLVNSPVAARVLSAAAEEMVVFRGRSFDPVRRSPRERFPSALDAMYVRRFIKEREADRMEYDPGRRELRLPGATALSRTSAEAQVSVPLEVRAQFLIPLKATTFCFVYPCSEMPQGGYLYIYTDRSTVTDFSGTPLVINKVYRAAGNQAMAFGAPIALSAQATQHIHSEFQDLPPGDPYLEYGAVQFAWVTSELVPDVEGLKLGGFAYVFSDPDRNCIFPLQAVGEVLTMANMKWDVSARALGMRPTGEELEHCIDKKRGGLGRKPVSIMRISAPDVLHPMMLHALAFTPREDVLATDVAKAISYAAFSRAWPFYVQHFVLDCVSAFSLGYVSWEIHDLNDSGKGHWDFEWPNVCVFTVIALALLKNVYDELKKIIGFWRCKWMHHYLNSNTLSDLGSMAVTTIVLLLLASPEPPKDHGYLRTLLAAAGFLKWIQVVNYFRGVLALNLGLKFLPINYTLREGLSFLMVVIFFIMAVFHAFYSLYPEKGTSWTHLFSLTYNLGFLGDFDSEDILSATATAGENSWAWVQQISFAGASMLVTVMLTNIYIGVMGNAYNRYHEKAVELFVRARASICLDISLQHGTAWSGQDERFMNEYVWFCRADPSTADSPADGNGELSVHQIVREMQQTMEKKQQTMEKQMESLSRQMQELLQKHRVGRRTSI